MSEFNFPNACACCGKEEPDTLWKLKCSEVVLHEPELGYNRSMKDFNEYITHVPICSACERSLKLRDAACWGVGIACGAAAGIALGFDMAADGDAKLPAIYIAGAVVGLIVAGTVGWLVRFVASLLGILTCADYQPRESRIRFYNKQYQQLFDSLNFTAHVPVTQAQREHWAKPWT
jgi:hypothetical protein